MELLNDVKRLLKKELTSVVVQEELRRLSIEVESSEWKKTIETLYYENLLSFNILKVLVHVSCPDGIKIAVELRSNLRSENVNVSTLITPGTSLESITNIWGDSDWFEHEINERTGQKIFDGTPGQSPFIGDLHEH